MHVMALRDTASDARLYIATRQVEITASCFVVKHILDLPFDQISEEEAVHIPILGLYQGSNIDLIFQPTMTAIPLYALCLRHPLQCPPQPLLRLPHIWESPPDVQRCDVGSVAPSSPGLQT
jgi:hypothetical protein